MRILHIPTAMTFEWKKTNYYVDFEDISEDDYVFIWISDRAFNGGVNWAEAAAPGTLMATLKSQPHIYRHAYEFVVIEE